MGGTVKKKTNALVWAGAPERFKQSDQLQFGCHMLRSLTNTRHRCCDFDSGVTCRTFVFIDILVYLLVHFLNVGREVMVFWLFITRYIYLSRIVV